MELAFSTLACPHWSTAQAAQAARTYGYDGIELRLVNGKPIESVMLRQQVGSVKEDLAGLRVASLNSSIRLAADGPEWQAEFSVLSDLAAELQAPSVRVWGGEYGHALSRADAIEKVSERLNLAADIAAGAGITVTFETHDAWRELETVERVFEKIEKETVKVLWDVQNTHARGGSTPQQVWDSLGTRITQIHVKDARPGEGEYGELVELGKGKVPVRESIKVLTENNFRGWITVNWLKFQHPEILDPEIALPQYAKVLRQWISTSARENT